MSNLLASVGIFLVVLSIGLRRCDAQVTSNKRPTPTSSFYTFFLDEEQPIGAELHGGLPSSHLEATDQENDPIMFIIPATSINADVFGVNSSTGVLYFKQILDRDVRNSGAYVLFVEVDDGVFHGNGVEPPKIEVQINLRDINDNAPVFTNLPESTSLPESTDVDTTIFTVSSEDSDIGKNALVDYSIASVNGETCTGISSTLPCTMFSIDVTTGMVILNASLDYDDPNQRVHKLSILTEDRGDVPLSTVAVLTVNVLDVNDLPPSFDRPDYFVDVHENLTFGASIIQVRASDQDTGVNDSVSYAITSGNSEFNGNESFAINTNTGLISVNTDFLDRETHQDYILLVQATEDMDTSRSATARVTITVFDINDNAPFFARTFYSANVSEGAAVGTAVVVVTALDRDHGPNAEFQFTLKNSLNTTDLPFSIQHDINSGEGTIVLSELVDFETTTTYSFTVVATEMVNDSPMSGVTMVTVNVINENDNNPIFQNDTYYGRVPENAEPGAFVALVFARDSDLGSFGNVEYSIVASSSGASNFNITATGGAIATAVRLNHEQQNQYILQILARDLDQNPATRNEGQATLIVDVVNLNDNTPEFVTDMPRPQLRISEELPPLINVYTFTAFDADGELNPLTFEIEEGNTLGVFMINGNNLVTTRELDFDLVTVNQTYTLRVIVNDTANYNDLVLDVQVVDINDNSPIFGNSSYLFRVNENVPVGSFVDTVSAQDIDSGTYGEVRYTLIGPGSDNFFINSTTGVITTAASLDREVHPQPFELVVTATDQDNDTLARNSGSSQITITITDENDNSPRFERTTYIFNVLENTDFVSLMISATDADIGTNSQITYSITGGNVDSAFVLDGLTGIISRNTSIHLDHERQATYTLTITASDGGSPSNNALADVIVDIGDENDIVPTFDQTEFNSTIREDLPSGQIVRQLEARDDDSNENGQLTYSITSVTGPSNIASAPDGTFIIDESSGTIQTRGLFDREAFEGPYSVQVLVRDGGFPISHNSTTGLLVYISDTNDNRPIFMADTYTKSLSENLPVGESVTTVLATDRDMPGTNNSDIVYSISDVFVSNPPPLSDPDSHFSINSSTGEVSTSVQLDYEAIQSYRITVEAADRGNPQRSSNAFVTVTVLDMNDHGPVFSMDMYSINNTEDTPTNTRLSIVSATDADTPSNAVIMYSSSLASPFRIDTRSGELILTSVLDFENRTEYSFVVTATNAVAGGVIFSDNASVVIRVTDVNDNRPVFNQQVYTVSVQEGNYTDNPQRLNFTLVADDADSGNLGDVTINLLLPEQDSDLWEVRTISNGRDELYAVGNLDRESEDSYIVVVQARDGGDPSATATATVRISVEDVNDITPQLDRDSYSASVQEGNSPGQIIARVSAVDGDAGGNGEVILSIDDIANFDIDPSSGEITTRVEFDYEQQNNYVVVITASDNTTTNQLSSTALLTVNVTDANDNSPKFVSVPVVPSIPEDMPVGSVIATMTAMDIDSGSNSELIFRLSNNEGQFSIDENGIIAISSPLNREVRDEYNLTVTVLDRGQPQMSDVVFLPFTITDVNDVQPNFERDTYSFVIPEDIPLSSTIGTVVAMDNDIAGNSATLFGIEGDSSLFSIVRRTSGDFTYLGDIVNINRFDYEMESSYSLRVRAENIAMPKWVQYTNVTISIRDLNDNAPTFPVTTYQLSISENAPVGTPVGTLVATDSDGGVNGTVVYTFDPATASNIQTQFALNNESGVLTLANSLDFEAVPTFSFSVVASDQSDVPLSSSVTVNVAVQDANEDAPVFDQANYIGSVQENLAAGAFVVSVNATESDATSIEYSIVSGNAQRFTVDSATGTVTTLNPLDREEQDRYILTVQARDMGLTSLSSFTQVDISILDVNDNSPVFQSPPQFSLREDASAGSVVGRLLATDTDAGTNSEVTYSSPDSGPFTIRSDGEITVSDTGLIDYETTPIWNIVVRAIDGGTPTSSESVTILITLVDVNDNSPMFSEPTGYVTTVAENSDVGVSIVTVSAIDFDGDTPAFSIISGDDPVPNFSLDSQTGLIQTTVNRLDREALVSRQYTYTLNVEARDQRVNERTSLVTVTITVTDVNDIAPQCTMDPFEFTVDEGNDNTLRLGLIEALDGDSGSNSLVGYSIVSGDPNNLFSVTANTGDLFGLPTLDFETVPVHLLGVAAVDQAGDPSDRMSSLCMVTVTLRDVNDNRPAFSRAVYEASVLENANQGVTVTQVSATDLDSGVNGLFSFSFQTPLREFTIDAQTGVVTVSGSLDAETTPIFERELEVRDEGNPTRIGLARVIIRIRDINDNSPRFDRSFYSTSIAEDQPVNSDVVSPDASDPDSASLTYSIVSGNEPGIYFKINPTTGLIQTARSLDRETVAVFTLQVAASDDDGNTGTSTVQINLEDVNDEAPIFLQPSYYSRVLENSATGTQVLPVLNMSTIRIEAFDSDEANTQNSRVLYSLDGPNADLFDIDFNSAIVTVARGANLDRETMDMITVNVVARDSVPAPGTRSSIVELIVEVLDENDESPRFSQPFGYAFATSEGASIGDTLTSNVRASDPDEGDGGVVRYSISGASPLDAADWFNIDPVTGDITLAQTLDREMNNVITLTVSASDQGQPALVAIVSVQVTVTDNNDNPPQFSQGIYTATVPEFLAPGSSAFQVFASDSDVGNNADVLFEVSPPNNRFSVNPNTGIIATTGPLDHEDQDTYTFFVQACDSGIPVMCSSAIVTISVGDFNDETPMFDLSVYTVDVCDDALLDRYLVQPVAIDRDSGSNAEITYSLQGDPWALFIIDSLTGLISLQRDIDDADVDIGTFQLFVIATDGGDTPLSGRSSLSMRVRNCSDMPLTFNLTYFYLEINEGSNQFISSALPTVVLGLSSGFNRVYFSPDYRENPFMLVTSGNALRLKTEQELDMFGIGQGVGLDREVRELYTVIVAAEEQLPSQEVTYCSVTLRVLDSNDNAPQLSSELYIFSVRENMSSPLVVGSTTATDRDTGANANIVYDIVAILPPTTPSPFAMNPTSGEITTTTELDREAVDRYNLTIQASDGTLSNTAQVIVNVQDINDCQPMFDQPVYTIPVLENRPSGSSIATVRATDCDIGINAQLEYTVVAGNIGVISVHRGTGAVTTMLPLDFEQQTDYFLTVQVSDMGLPNQRTSQVDVNILIQDFNDCPPLFNNVPTSLTLMEGEPIGTVLHTLTVTDCDSGLNGVDGTRFSIIAGNTGGVFSINPTSGVLFTVQMLDRELLANFVLSVQAQDSAGTNSLLTVTQLSIVVGDVNDNSPTFPEREIFITIRENEDTDSTFLVVMATDIDQGLNGDIVYSLLNDEGVFDIDEGTGAISLIQLLDRETTDRYNLTVIARDRGTEPRSGNLTIFVTVSDVNDNSPLILNITSGVTMINILEGTDTGTPIFVVSARDEDKDSNGEVSFSLEDLSRSLPFVISPTGGVLTISGLLDYETQNEYTVVVIASDNGSPQRLSTVATLTINIDDDNDNPPRFMSVLYEASQSEGVASGTSIVSVLATDADQTGTPNADLEYSIVSGDFDLFSVDRITGVISNNVELDRENRSLYSLTVVANNSNSHTPLFDDTFVEITILDVNDEIPVFDEQSYAALLRELTPTGSPVITVSAVDNDQPGTPNSALVYSIARQTNNPFSIDPNTGEVVLLNSLDFETTTSYSLTLVVEDKGAGVASSTSQLIISVIDENDVSPTFSQNTYTAEVSEGVVSLPYPLINLMYNDRDTLTVFRESTFSILEVQPPSPGLFYVVTTPGSETGVVYMNKSIDFESQQLYTLSLSVENNMNGTGPMCNFQPVCTFSQTATLDIAVTDENDNAPVFSRQTYIGEVSSTASTGTSILSVLATDDDLGEVSRSVVYSLTSSITLPFRIDPTSGTLLTRGILNDIPSGSKFDLKVRAEDNNGGPQSNTAEATIRIVVLDDFDRIAFEFSSAVNCIVTNELVFAEFLSNVTGWTVVIERYLEYATDERSLFIIHALDENGVVVDFAQFTDRIQNFETDIQRVLAVCNLTSIISFAEAEEPYEYPPFVDTQTIVILVLCLLLILGSSVLLVMAVTQRYLALNDARHKLLADVFYGGSPHDGSVVDNVQQENYQLETLELTGKSVNRQNPMFVHPYDNWAGVDTSGVESVGGASSLTRDNPLYESQEIRMEMFADVHSDDEEADDAELLAQALADDEDDDEDENAVTAI